MYELLRDAIIKSYIRELDFANFTDKRGLAEILYMLTPPHKQNMLNLDPELGFSDDRIRPYVLIMNSLEVEERKELLKN